jgi:UPF0755 protein
MDNEKRLEDMSSEEWLDELFKKPYLADEILADEQAVASAGLTHPSDLEFEKIMRDALNEDWSIDDEVMESELPIPEFIDVAPFQDEEFLDTFGETDLEQIFNESAPAEAPVNTQPISDPALAATRKHTVVIPQEIPQAEAEEDPIPEEVEVVPRTAEKGRPKRKNKYGLFGIPHVVVTAIWIALILLIGVTVGRMVWLCAQDVLAFGRDPITATVTIAEEDSIEDIAKKLKDAGLIRYPGLFKMYANLSDAQEEIRPGTYSFNTGGKDEEKIVYDYMALVSHMSPATGLVVVEDLRIPEGYTCAQIFKLLEEKNVCSAEDLEKACMDPEFKLDGYWFLKDLDRSNKYCLEGYLFPNTYDFYENDEPERVLRKMLDAFNANFTDVMRDKLSKLEGYSLKEVIIIASMIEKESANLEESYAVSAVIYNRLKNSSKYPYLNIDATLVYALGKNNITIEDTKIDHPYNTYKYPGLTPGPISNPSQNSIAAALEPDSDYAGYYFYALDPSTNKHHFSKTYEEHLKFLASLED